MRALRSLRPFFPLDDSMLISKRRLMMRPIRQDAYVHDRGGRSYDIEVAHYFDHVRVRAYITRGNTRRPVGRAYLDKVGDDMLRAPVVRDATLYIDPLHRRRGVATALYDAAERSTGRRCIPSRTLTGNGTAFWKDYRARAVQPAQDEAAQAPL